MINRLLPPMVIRPVVMVIGLSVAATASEMAMGKSGGNQAVGYAGVLILLGFTFAVTVVVSTFDSRMMRPIPILTGVAASYTSALITSLMDTATIATVPWFVMPHFETPQVNWQAVLFMLSTVIVPATKHIDDVMAIGGITDDSYTRDSGLDKTLMDDDLGVCVTGLIDGPPVMTYGGVTGAVMITEDNNPVIMTRAATFTIAMAFSDKSNAFLVFISPPVVGDIMLPLFGTIASLGTKTLVDTKMDLIQSENLVTVNSVLTVGVGGITVHVGTPSSAGVGLYAVLAIILSCLLPTPETEIELSSGPA